MMNLHKGDMRRINQSPLNGPNDWFVNMEAALIKTRPQIGSKGPTGKKSLGERI